MRLIIFAILMLMLCSSCDKQPDEYITRTANCADPLLIPHFVNYDYSKIV